MNKLCIFLVLIGWSFGSLAGDKEDSEFYVQENLVKKIYDDIKKQESKKIDTEMSVAFEQMILSDMSLSSRYFSVDYNENIGSFQAVNIGVLKTLTRYDQWILGLNGFAGYGVKKGNYNALSANKVSVKDNISLQWIPVRAAFTVNYDTAGLWIQPGVEAGLGSHWIFQNGNLDGMTQSFWIPTYFLGANLRLFKPALESDSSFRGIDLTSRLESKISGDQSLESLSFNVAVNFTL